MAKEDELKQSEREKQTIYLMPYLNGKRDY